MIPVRVPAAAMPVLANERRFTVLPGHPLAEEPCPACEQPLAGPPVVLVFVGIAPEDRKPSGWTTGAAVAVHAACAGVPGTEPQAERAVMPDSWECPKCHDLFERAGFDHEPCRNASEENAR